MTKFIGMEYLAALALIKLDKEQISLCDLNEFRINAVQALSEDNLTSIVFLFSDNYALDMVRNYSDCFELLENDTVLRRKVSNENLIARFVSYLSNDIMRSIYKERKKYGQDSED